MKDRPTSNQLWTCSKTGDVYSIEHIGKMKIETDEWLESVTYSNVGTGEVYTRDMSTFLEKFEKLSKSGGGGWNMIDWEKTKA